jgi:hypothetical protein
MPPDALRELHELAGRVRRLLPDWRDPERFFEARSEIRRARSPRAKPPGRCPGIASLGTGYGAATAPLPLRLSPAIRVAAPAPPAPPVTPAPALPAAPRLRRRHRFPRPPRLCPSVQPRLVP